MPDTLWLAANFCVAVLTVALSWLFSRFRGASLALLLVGWLAALPLLEASGMSGMGGGFALALAGSALIAAPDLRLLSARSLVWFLCALALAVGICTLDLSGLPPAHRIATFSTAGLWSVALLLTRTRLRRSTSRTELLLFSALVGGSGLTVAFAHQPPPFSSAGQLGLALLLQLGCLSAVVDHTFQLAYIDELTEIPGRRALREALSDPGSPYTLAMLDVDHFKSFNDTHGHDVGDQVLRLVAARLSTVGEGGRAYRYGGEEFTIYFPGRTDSEVESELERLRALIENSPLTLRASDRPKEAPKKRKPVKKTAKRAPKKKSAEKARPQVGVTISIGSATRRTGESWERVLKRADEALYEAKKAGRNRIHRAS